MAQGSFNELTGGPGGPVVAALNALNSYEGNKYDTRVKEQQAEWAPYTVPAEAASKLAYAGLVGPQHILKLLSNPALLANLSEEDKRKLLDFAKSGGLNAGNISDKLNPLARNGNGQPQGNGAPPQNAFVQNAPAQQGVDTQNANALNNYNAQNGAPQNALGNQALPMTPVQKQRLHDLYGGPNAASQNTFAQNEGLYKGAVEQQKELGSEIGRGRGKQINALHDEVKVANSYASQLGAAYNLLRNPEIENIGDHPLLRSAQIEAFARGAVGTPEQQRIAGQYKSMLKHLVINAGATRELAGPFRQGEQSLYEGAKPSETDSFPAARGKLELMGYLTKMKENRAIAAAHYMENGYSEGDAILMADKDVNGEEVRDTIRDKVYGLIPVKEVDKKGKPTGKTKMITSAEARRHKINLDNYSGPRKGTK